MDHGRREVHAGDAVTAGGKLEGFVIRQIVCDEWSGVWRPPILCSGRVDEGHHIDRN